ncbi:MAG: DNA translocase FtsK 4TM domain-containing protein [Patulibacter minatonensis]
MSGKVPKQPPRAQPRKTPKRAQTPPAPQPLLDQRQLDVLGLALIAFGILIAIPLYRAGAGGVFGEGVADGARLLLGTAALGAPLLAVGGGLVCVSPISVASTIRIGVGGLSGFGAVALIARASQGPKNAASWESHHLRDAGGALGETLWSICHATFGSFGPYVVAVVMILVAALLLTGAEVASVARGAGRGLARAIRVPGRVRAQRRADREERQAAWEEHVAIPQAEGGPVWDGPGTWGGADATHGGGDSTGGRSGRGRQTHPTARRAPAPEAQLPLDPPRTWTSHDEDQSATGTRVRSRVAPPELPGIDPVVRRAARPVQLIDGAERFPDLFGHDGPIWIGPDAGFEDASPASAPVARRVAEPYPDPLAEFDAELTSARQEGGVVDEDLLDADDYEDVVLPDERNGAFAEEALEAEPYDDAPMPVDDPFLDDEPQNTYDERLDEDIDAPSQAGAKPVGPEALTPMGRYRAEVTESPEFEWRIPPRRFLTRSPKEKGGPSRADQQQTSALLLEALGHFGVSAELVGCVAGPHITRYELRLAPGVKMNKVANLKDDLAYALAATDIRILAPIPGKTAVGVEVPNRNRAMVRLGDVFDDAPPKSSPINVWLGKDVEGRSIFADLAKMPHLLVAGTTGAGKSGCINAMLSSILLTATPHDVRMVLVDPKQVELTPYESIPHLLTPVITSPKMAATALQNLVREMEARYSTMALARTRSLPELNRVRRERGEQEFPYILCVIDELADLMMVAPGEVEDSIIRIAQKARAVGIHLVLATQSPRVDVITGMIKANVPSRIAFAVSSQTDSRVILDQNGAESLLGQGDMLFAPVGSAKLQRIQGAYIDEEQIEQITGYWRRQGEPDFKEELLEEVGDEPVDEAKGDGLDPDEDPMLEEAIRLVVEMGTASTSMMQRRLRVGYTRAGRLIDMLERRQVISGYEGSKARQVLIGPSEVERIVAQVRARGASDKPTLFPEDAPAAATPAAGGDEPPTPAGTATDVVANASQDRPAVAPDDADR